MEAAVSALDAEGVERLTLRGLAAELGSGVASLYWYASGKGELLDLATDAVLGEAIEVYGRQRTPESEPLENLRTFMLALFDQMMEHRWLALQLMESSPRLDNSLLTWELVGRELARMDLTRQQQFNASIMLVNFATAMGAEITVRPEPEGAAREEAMQEQIDEWRQGTDPERFPFIHSIMGEFENHDDRSQFLAGVDLMLSGIERQAG
ncbi:TetR/AcrR family transcriptional regulator [Arthrobacter sp. UM1]|uniref:TetR/AcrR family transcriptional regulator n=1 Tax=Arthrobacter sp. UM1 TaxID=2766776 RepID=UPI001CF6BDED|nr:TetR/AcrR family transcriptional regulator [Arthrobacter sp. UM1]